MIYLLILFEFFQIGLFSVGGGLATLPFLMDLVQKRHWYTLTELTNMIAISESTPGPIGINMATYTGYVTAGFGGSLAATFALVLPSFIVILIISRMLQKFRENRYVDASFYGIRPASAALISSALLSLIVLILFPETADGGHALNILSLILLPLFFGCMQIKKVKKLHPVFWIAIGAVIGIIFKM